MDTSPDRIFTMNEEGWDAQAKLVEKYLSHAC